MIEPEIKTIGIEALPDDNPLKDFDWDNFPESSEKVNQWLKDNPDYFYYARPRESFSEAEAFELAKLAGAKIIIWEDMS